MILSIVTVNYNNPIGLERTIQSVVDQTNKDFEYIIVDGASTMGDVGIISKYNQYIARWVSEPDTGIYNAMNKAVKMANGDYCLFMNSGDTLYSDKTVEEIYRVEFDEDYIEGRINTENGIQYPPPNYTLGSYLYKRNNYHQASLIKRKLLLQHPYDETMRIASDMKFNIEVLVIYNCSYKPIDVVISNYEGNGVSMTISHQEEIDRIFNELIPVRIYQDYVEDAYLHRYPSRHLLGMLKKMDESSLLYKLKIWIKKLLRKPISEKEIEEYKKK